MTSGTIISHGPHDNRALPGLLETPAQPEAHAALEHRGHDVVEPAPRTEARDTRIVRLGARHAGPLPRAEDGPADEAERRRGTGEEQSAPGRRFVVTDVEQVNRRRDGGTDGTAEPHGAHLLDARRVRGGERPGRQPADVETDEPAERDVLVRLVIRLACCRRSVAEHTADGRAPEHAARDEQTARRRWFEEDARGVAASGADG